MSIRWRDATCHCCIASLGGIPVHKIPPAQEVVFQESDLVDEIGGYWSDGAYHALAWELGG